METFVPLFEDYIAVNESGELKKLVSKTEDQELSPEDAKIIGRKIADMTGDDRKKNLARVTALGGFYSGSSAAGKEKLTKLRHQILDAYHAKADKQEETKEKN